MRGKSYTIVTRASSIGEVRKADRVASMDRSSGAARPRTFKTCMYHLSLS